MALSIKNSANRYGLASIALHWVMALVIIGMYPLGLYIDSLGYATDLNRIGSYLGAMAQSNADVGAEVTPPQADRETAQILGSRVAAAAQRWKQ